MLTVGDRQPLNAVQPAGTQPFRGTGLLDRRHGAGYRVEYQADLQFCQVHADAVVRAGATEAQVRLRAAQDVEPLRAGRRVRGGGEERLGRRFRYDGSMTNGAKRKVSVTLDADLVAAIEAEGRESLSAEVNSALRAQFASRRRQQALGELLDHLAGERGHLDTPEDEAEISRYMRLLGGLPGEADMRRAG